MYPQPRSSTRMPGRKSSAEVSHSVIQSEFAPPLTQEVIHSGLYFDARGNSLNTKPASEFMLQNRIYEDKELLNARSSRHTKSEHDAPGKLWMCWNLRPVSPTRPRRLWCMNEKHLDNGNAKVTIIVMARLHGYIDENGTKRFDSCQK